MLGRTLDACRDPRPEGSSAGELHVVFGCDRDRRGGGLQPSSVGLRNDSSSPWHGRTTNSCAVLFRASESKEAPVLVKEAPALLLLLLHLAAVRLPGRKFDNIMDFHYK